MRLSLEGEALLAVLGTAMRRELGINISMSDVIQAGLSELKKRYAPNWTYQEPKEPEPPAKPTAKRGRPRKKQTPPAK